MVNISIVFGKYSVHRELDYPIFFFFWPKRIRLLTLSDFHDKHSNLFGGAADVGKRSKPQNIRNEEYPSDVRRTASARCLRVAAD